jgi:hypothetical protein
MDHEINKAVILIDVTDSISPVCTMNNMFEREDSDWLANARSNRQYQIRKCVYLCTPFHRSSQVSLPTVDQVGRDEPRYTLEVLDMQKLVLAPLSFAWVVEVVVALLFFCVQLGPHIHYSTG